MLPSLQGLNAAEVDEGGKLALLMEGVQGAEIGQAVVSADGAGSAVQLQEDVVHEQPRRASVAIGKGMDIDQLRMKVCGDGQSIFLGAFREQGLLNLGCQCFNKPGNLLRRGSHIIGDAIVALLERSRPLALAQRASS